MLADAVCIGPFRPGQRRSIAKPMPSSPPKQTLDAFVPADGIICSHIVNLPLLQAPPSPTPSSQALGVCAGTGKNIRIQFLLFWILHIL